MGTYHPHGDSAIYDALVRMVQDFSMRHPLIDGHGNFGGHRARRGPGGHALHRVPARPAGPRAHGRASTRRRSTSSPNYSNAAEEPIGPPGPVPQPAGQRVPGHRGRHGHQHPAPQPGRGHRRHHPPDRAPRGHPRRPHGVREGPGLPDRRAHPRAPGDPRRLPDRPRARSRCGRSPRSRRAGAAPSIVVTELPYQTSVEVVEQKIDDLVRVGRSRRHRRGPERLGRRARPAWSSG